MAWSLQGSALVSHYGLGALYLAWSLQGSALMGTRGMPAGWLIGCFYCCLQLIMMMIIKYNNNDNNDSNNNNNNNDCVEKHISRFFTISSLRREHVHSCGLGAIVCK